MISSVYRYLRGVSILCGFLLLVSCGGDSSSGDKANLALTAAPSGSVSLVLTDAPSTEFSSVVFTFTKIEFIGAESGHVTLFEGEQSVDLLSLTNFGQLLAVVDHVPAGSYSKIRLTLKKPDGIKLIPKDGSDPVYPPLAGNGKMDLNPRHPFTVIADQMLYLQLDVDAKKSFHIAETGKGKPEYIVRPVVFIDVLSDQLNGKLVRVSGYAHNSVSLSGSFILCNDSPDSTAAYDAVTEHLCVEVSTQTASTFSSSGDSSMAADIQAGDRLTVVGFVDTSRVSGTGAPPIGMHAEVIELGSPGAYFILNAVIDMAPVSATDTFTFDTSMGSNIPAQLQAGAKIFRRDGERLDYTAIQSGVEAGLDGAPAATEPGVMKTTLVVIDHQPPALIDTLSGPIQSISLAGSSLLDSSLMINDVMVLASSETAVIAAGVSGDTVISETISLAELMNGDDVVIYGQYNTEGQLLADVILKKI